VQAWEAWVDDHGEALQVLAEAAGQVPGPVAQAPGEDGDPA
jgi:hypothetical protein